MSRFVSTPCHGTTLHLATEGGGVMGRYGSSVRGCIQVEGSQPGVGAVRGQLVQPPSLGECDLCEFVVWPDFIE